MWSGKSLTGDSGHTSVMRPEDRIHQLSFGQRVFNALTLGTYEKNLMRSEALADAQARVAQLRSIHSGQDATPDVSKDVRMPDMAPRDEAIMMPKVSSTAATFYPPQLSTDQQIPNCDPVPIRFAGITYL